MIIATAGHVDHGKTLLVNAITGVDTDRLDEEKQRGLTIDLGFAYTDVAPNCRLGFIDVPGHTKFINNMLAGVGAVDFALLVIAADDGIMPQTREHLAVLDLLQIPRGAVALTKVDRVDDTRVQQVRTDIAELLAGTSLSASPIYPVSAVTGQGVDDLISALAHTAGTLARSEPDGYFRLAIDRCFTVKGTGLVVTGSVFAGQTAVGDTLYLTHHSAQTNVPVRVRGIHTRNQESKSARAGDRCALNIAGNDLDRDMIHRGDWLVGNKSHQAADRIDAEIRLLSSETRPLRHWTPVHVHAAASHVTGRVATLDTSRINPGETGLVQLVLSRPLNVCRGDNIVLRDQGASRTLGGGKVLDPFSPKRGRAKPARLAHLAALANKDTGRAITKLLEIHREGLHLPGLFDALNLPDDNGKKLLLSCGAKIIADNYAFSADAIRALKGAMIHQLEQWHKDNPEAPGLPENQLRARLNPRPAQAVMNTLVEELIDTSKIVRAGNLLHLPGHSATLSEREARLWEQIRSVLAQSPTKPPVVHDLAKQLDLAPGVVEKLLARCAQIGYVVRPVKNRFFLPEGLEELKEQLFPLAASSPDGLFTASDYRNVTGIGRNLAIELLEYFDRTGITQRVGDQRKILHTSANIN